MHWAPHDNAAQFHRQLKHSSANNSIKLGSTCPGQLTKCQWGRFTVQAGDPFAVAMRALPVLYGTSVGTVLSLVLLKAQPTQAWPSWLTALVTIAVAVAVGIAVQLLLVPQMHCKISSWGEPGQVALSDRAQHVEAGSESKMSAL